MTLFILSGNDAEDTYGRREDALALASLKRTRVVSIEINPFLVDSFRGELVAY